MSEALHASPRLVGPGVGFEVGLDSGGERELFNTVDGGVRGDCPATQLL